MRDGGCHRNNNCDMYTTLITLNSSFSQSVNVLMSLFFRISYYNIYDTFKNTFHYANELLFSSLQYNCHRNMTEIMLKRR